MFALASQIIWIVTDKIPYNAQMLSELNLKSIFQRVHILGKTIEATSKKISSSDKQGNVCWKSDTELTKICKHSMPLAVFVTIHLCSKTSSFYPCVLQLCSF